MGYALTPPLSPDPLRQFGFLLKDASRLYSRNVERHLGGLGLTLAECRVLGHLQRREGICQAQLADLTETDPMTLGRLVTRMVDEGLIERRANPQDGRARSLYLGDKALALLDDMWLRADRARGEALAGLTGDERAQLTALLRRVHDNLEILVAGRDRRPAPEPRQAAS